MDRFNQSGFKGKEMEKSQRTGKAFVTSRKKKYQRKIRAIPDNSFKKEDDDYDNVLDVHVVAVCSTRRGQGTRE